jgi:hypothetical protein
VISCDRIYYDAEQHVANGGAWPLVGEVYDSFVQHRETIWREWNLAIEAGETAGESLTTANLRLVVSVCLDRRRTALLVCHACATLPCRMSMISA